MERTLKNKRYIDYASGVDDSNFVYIHLKKAQRPATIIKLIGESICRRVIAIKITETSAEIEVHGPLSDSELLTFPEN